MFVGRETELQDLMSLWRKRTSSIIACRGRQRIGKSTLFREFARRSADVYMEFEGLAPNPEKPVTKADQLSEFATRLAKLTQTPKTAYVVEVKRRQRIGVEIEDEVAERMRRLPLRKGLSKRPVLVYNGELDPAVEADGFFSALISARQLLGI